MKFITVHYEGHRRVFNIKYIAVVQESRRTAIYTVGGLGPWIVDEDYETVVKMLEE